MEPKKVLIIEDDHSLRELFVVKLATHAWDVILAADGEEGLIRAKTEKPDLIILDIVMPRMSGFELLARIKSDPFTRGMGVFILTNLSLDTDFTRGRELGADEYLIKSHLSWNDLIAKMDSMVGRRPKGGLFEDRVCPKCGEDLSSRAKFCPACGVEQKI